jgi:dienelactone hydrolase
MTTGSATVSGPAWGDTEVTRAAVPQQGIAVPRRDGASVPLRVLGAGENAPLALLSHGVGGSEKRLVYLARGLHEKGWTTIVIGHRESGPAPLRDSIFSYGLRHGMLRLTTAPDAYRARFDDIGAALAWAGSHYAASFTALIGHSMGAATVMLEAGAANQLGLQGQDRFDAYVALSPQGPGSIFPQGAWRAIRKPVLVITGTRDHALEGSWQTRTIPFNDMPPGGKALAVIGGATHVNLAGIGFSKYTEQAAIRITSVFLDNVRHGRSDPLPASAGINIRTK